MYFLQLDFLPYSWVTIILLRFTYVDTHSSGLIQYYCCLKNKNRQTNKKQFILCSLAASQCYNEHACTCILVYRCENSFWLSHT